MLLSDANSLLPFFLDCEPRFGIAIFAFIRFFESANRVTLLAGFLASVVYTQRRVPDTEKVNGYKEEV